MSKASPVRYDTPTDVVMLWHWGKEILMFFSESEPIYFQSKCSGSLKTRCVNWNSAVKGKKWYEDQKLFREEQVQSCSVIASIPRITQSIICKTL